MQVGTERVGYQESLSPSPRLLSHFGGSETQFFLKALRMLVQFLHSELALQEYRSGRGWGTPLLIQEELAGLLAQHFMAFHLSLA